MQSDEPVIALEGAGATATGALDEKQSSMIIKLEEIVQQMEQKVAEVLLDNARQQEEINSLKELLGPSLSTQVNGLHLWSMLHIRTRESLVSMVASVNCQLVAVTVIVSDYQPWQSFQLDIQYEGRIVYMPAKNIIHLCIISESHSTVHMQRCYTHKGVTRTKGLHT